jgi:thiamine pyrophosphokinase
MGNCIIFCAADFHGLLAPLANDDFIIAADGGLNHTNALGITPNGILGDFDSLGYTPEGSTVFPVEKDDTDAMLAVRKGLELGYREFYLYGSLDGPRLDHTVANFQTLQFLCDHGAFGYLIGKDYIITALKDGAIHFGDQCSCIFSVFCMGADAKGVTIKGGKYDADNVTLSAGFPPGVSNHFEGHPVTVSVKDGSLLVLWDTRNGFPAR